MRQKTKAEVCLDEGKSTSSGPARRATRTIGCERGWLRPSFIAVRLKETEDRAQQPRNPGKVGLAAITLPRSIPFPAQSITGLAARPPVDSIWQLQSKSQKAK